MPHFKLQQLMYGTIGQELDVTFKFCAQHSGQHSGNELRSYTNINALTKDEPGVWYTQNNSHTFHFYLKGPSK